VGLVVGLGNPGSDYADTRHNVGWWVVDRLARRWRATPDERRAEYRSWTAAPRDKRVTLLEPLTFMNLSGDAVNAWREGHELNVEELLVVTDDVYLPVGALRVRPEGSSGGHRGLESIEAALGGRGYPRLRIGVGAPVTGLRQHVLDTPSGDERLELERAADRAADAVECWWLEGILETMNRFNRKVSKEVSES
jgi:peptidyl-tRNA hydrolase, PTH1 family